MKESLSNKEKLISQLTNQIQASNQANQSEAPKEDKAADLRIENEDLKVEWITKETFYFEFSIWFILILYLNIMNRFLSCKRMM